MMVQDSLDGWTISLTRSFKHSLVFSFWLFIKKIRGAPCVRKNGDDESGQNWRDAGHDGHAGLHLELFRIDEAPDVMQALLAFRGVGGIMASESVLRSAGTILSRVRAPPPPLAP
ncbi:hypothetical protein PoB_004760600 [Plakobranchus ocellatus]|uniref:Uncharacterized protein n=1 Tax=Plakobranchus ocellatus TaxID=259542 RepID=A0AAV4BCM2_9GAST|nr:hypothetical protein PoB_004760600 [Plakobranchus ocellatus]